jgi:hypothetical protein
MCHHILNSTGKVVQQTTVRALTKSKQESELEKAKRAPFDRQIEAKLRPNAKPSDFTDDGDSETPDFETCLDDTDGTKQRMQEADKHDVNLFDKHLGAETQLSSGDSMLRETLRIRRAMPMVIQLEKQVSIPCSTPSLQSLISRWRCLRACCQRCH